MHICEECGKEFVTSKESQSTRFCCKSCRYSYITKKARAARTLIHDQTPGTCQFCGKLCKNQNSLRNHERVCKENPNRQAIENWAGGCCGGAVGWANLTEEQRNHRIDAIRKGHLKRQASYKPTLHICPYCGREKMTNTSGETTHEKFCLSNPNREVNLRKGTHLSEEAKQYLRSRPGNGGVRKGAGHGKHGWYKGFWCDSSWELAYVIYCLDHNIAIERNHDWFPYVFEGRQRKYYPDFKVGDEYIEIKNYDTPMVIAKVQQFPLDKKLKVLHEGDLTQVFAYVKEKYGENYTELYQQ